MPEISIQTPASQTRSYKLDYSHGSKMHVLHFEFAGQPNHVRDYAKDFCERMGYRFHFCSPFIVKLEDIEMQKAYQMRFAENDAR